MKKKLFIILGLLSVILMVLIYMGFNYYQNKDLDKKIISDSETFVNLWGNYSDASSSNYLSSIKPYISKSLYQDARQTADELESFHENGYLPNESKVTIVDNFIITFKNKDTISVKGSINREYVEVKKYYESVYITWHNIDGNYIITKIYTEDEEQS